ncbi:MAG: hypothetical protein ACRYFX_19805 [Janthinobacterium lividum]
MRPLLTLPYLHLSLHEGPAPVLELQWLSFVNSADFRAAATQALELSRTHHVKAWLGDDRLLGAVRPRDLEWAEQAILLPLAQAGLERFALLKPQDRLNHLTIESMYARVIPAVDFEIRYFDDLTLARAWAGGRAI